MTQLLMLAGGGTGGHLFPGLAVADEFIRRDTRRQVVVVGTGRPVERRAVARTPYELRLLSVRPLRGRTVSEQVLSLLSIPLAVAQSAALIAQLRPTVVLGLGGYVSGPLVLASALVRIPTAVMEQNSVPGSTNRILGRLRLIRRAYLTFDISRRHFASEASRVFGNPVRADLVDVREQPISFDPPSVLVLGGSQGAQRLNHSVPDALAEAGVGDCKTGVKVLHQTGDAMAEAVRRRYDELGLNAEVHSFIDDMAGAYRAATLVIGRAGATTLAELGVVGRPAILVPYPFAIDDHQRKNAEELERAGAAKIVLDRDATPEGLAPLVRQLLIDEPSQLQEMAEAAVALGRPDASAQVVDDLEELIGVR